ncbi:hypothetical protein VNO77_04072 [Canavalia gladiata]|uniref:Uncharacterized protein n=1 Tax=Canavalia gladiata TaxID=3824 RepID=A0AAN9MXY4_CANGL
MAKDSHKLVPMTQRGIARNLQWLIPRLSVETKRDGEGESSNFQKHHQVGVLDSSPEPKLDLKPKTFRNKVETLVSLQDDLPQVLDLELEISSLSLAPLRLRRKSRGRTGDNIPPNFLMNQEPITSHGLEFLTPAKDMAPFLLGSPIQQRMNIHHNALFFRGEIWNCSLGVLHVSGVLYVWNSGGGEDFVPTSQRLEAMSMTL